MSAEAAMRLAAIVAADDPNSVLQRLALETGAALARQTQDGRDEVLGEIVGVLDKRRWAGAQDQVIAGGAHAVREIARAGCDGCSTAEGPTCSSACGGGHARLCELLGQDLAAGDAKSAQGHLDEFALRIVGNESSRMRSIIHYGTYVVMGFEATDAE